MNVPTGHWIADGVFYIVVFVALALMALKINALRREVGHLKKKVRVLAGEELSGNEEDELVLPPGTQVIELVSAEANESTLG